MRRTESQDIAELFQKAAAKKAAVKKACGGCGGHDTDPIPAYMPRMAEWSQCEQCMQWWHAVCAGMEEDTWEKLDASEEDIRFICPHCLSPGRASSSAPPSNFDETDEEKPTAQSRRKHIVTEEEDDDT